MRRSMLFAAAVAWIGCSDDGSSAATSSSSSSIGGNGSSSGITAGTQSSTSSGSSTASGGATGSTSSSSSSTGVGGGSESSSSSGGSGGAAPVDPCVTATPICPNNPPAASGGGLKKIDRCNFPLSDDDTWDSNKAAFDGIGLTHATLADVLGDLNRTAVTASKTDIPGNVAGFQSGFSWQSGDESVAYWVPQGITGSADAAASGVEDGRKVLLATWYYDQAEDSGSTVDKGVRIAILDDTDPTNVTYRLLLLVAPKAGNPATFESVANVHAGGVAWYGNYLYVVDTTHGFRVFDLSDIRKVATDKDEIGYDSSSGKYYGYQYAYVVPQVDSYTSKSSCKPRFSFVSLDRSTTPPSLLAGEYCNQGGACDTYDGRLFRYPIDPATSRLTPG